jgi:26S proteasome regulatory subunit N12
MEAALAQLEGYVAAAVPVVAGNDTAAAHDGMKLLQQIKLARITGSRAATTTTVPGSTSTTMVVTDLQYIQALECGIFLSIQLQDLDQFIRHYQLVQPLYQLYSSGGTSSSNTPLPRKNHIIGLYLMSLLVTASSSEFHSELELLFAASMESKNSPIYDDPYIQFPISLERKLMVGIYDEIFNMTLPCATTYPFFMEQLVSTVRDAIADCIEVSYLSLSLPQTATIMKLDSASATHSAASDPVRELLEYIEVAREDWIVHLDTNTITFQQQQHSNSMNTAGVTITGQDVPSQQWIQQTLTYATEMERII